MWSDDLRLRARSIYLAFRSKANGLCANCMSCLNNTNDSGELYVNKVSDIIAKLDTPTIKYMNRAGPFELTTHARNRLHRIKPLNEPKRWFTLGGDSGSREVFLIAIYPECFSDNHESVVFNERAINTNPFITASGYRMNDHLGGDSYINITTIYPSLFSQPTYDKIPDLQRIFFTGYSDISFIDSMHNNFIKYTLVRTYDDIDKILPSIFSQHDAIPAEIPGLYGACTISYKTDTLVYSHRTQPRCYVCHRSYRYDINGPCSGAICNYTNRVLTYRGNTASSALFDFVSEHGTKVEEGTISEGLDTVIVRGGTKCRVSAALLNCENWPIGMLEIDGSYVPCCKLCMWRNDLTSLKPMPPGYTNEASYTVDPILLSQCFTLFSPPTIFPSITPLGIGASDDEEKLTHLYSIRGIESCLITKKIYDLVSDRFLFSLYDNQRGSFQPLILKDFNPNDLRFSGRCIARGKYELDYTRINGDWIYNIAKHSISNLFYPKVKTSQDRANVLNEWLAMKIRDPVAGGAFIKGLYNLRYLCVLTDSSRLFFPISEINTINKFSTTQKDPSIVGLRTLYNYAYVIDASYYCLNVIRSYMRFLDIYDTKYFTSGVYKPTLCGSSGSLDLLGDLRYPFYLRKHDADRYLVPTYETGVVNTSGFLYKIILSKFPTVSYAKVGYCFSVNESGSEVIKFSKTEDGPINYELIVGIDFHRSSLMSMDKTSTMIIGQGSDRKTLKLYVVSNSSAPHKLSNVISIVSHKEFYDTFTYS